MNEYSIKIIHNDSDPSAWTITLLQRRFLLNKKIETKWFNSTTTAMEYVETLKHVHNISK
jgi:hypothetical protein